MRLIETIAIPSIKLVTPLVRLQMAQAAQAVYDRWEQDPDGMDDEFGSGGICQDIADAMQDVLSHLGVDAIPIDNNGIDEQHVWLVAKFQEGVYEIDLPPSVYETGGGYTWRKIPDVQFQPSDIVFGKYSSNPADFETLFGNH